jgi:GR25 family glycosyltransferase involved in LPS biosynthesis
MFSILNVPIADHGFFINLDRSTDRLDNIKQQIDTFAIENLERFPAITDPLHQSSATKSHFAALSTAIERGYETVFIAEDDFQLYDDLFILDSSLSCSLKDYLPELMNDISIQEWDIVLLGFNAKKRCIPVSRHLSRNFKSTGAWGYIIKKPAIDFILKNFSYYRDRLAIDDILPYLTYHGFNSFATNVCTMHHAHGFVSTLQPSLGPIDYRQWILGNYYNSIWFYVDRPQSLQEALSQIYQKSEFNRNNIVSIKNYNGNIDQLMGFIEKNNQYYGTYIEIDTSNFPNIGYNIAVEWHNLIHSNKDTKKIRGLGQNAIAEYI